jgi:hypothetical protein
MPTRCGTESSVCVCVCVWVGVCVSALAAQKQLTAACVPSHSLHTPAACSYPPPPLKKNNTHTVHTIHTIHTIHIQKKQHTHRTHHKHHTHHTHTPCMCDTYTFTHTHTHTHAFVEHRFSTTRPTTASRSCCSQAAVAAARALVVRRGCRQPAWLQVAQT